jgi:hypothetical protein
MRAPLAATRNRVALPPMLLLDGCPGVGADLHDPALNVRVRRLEVDSGGLPAAANSSSATVLRAVTCQAESLADEVELP